MLLRSWTPCRKKATRQDRDKKSKFIVKEQIYCKLCPCPSFPGMKNPKSVCISSESVLLCLNPHPAFADLDPQPFFDKFDYEYPRECEAGIEKALHGADGF